MYVVVQYLLEVLNNQLQPIQILNDHIITKYFTITFPDIRNFAIKCSPRFKNNGLKFVKVSKIIRHQSFADKIDQKVFKLSAKLTN